MKSLLQFVSACLLCFGIASTASAQNLMDRFVLEGKEAVTVLPVELVAAPTVKRVYPSPDGYRMIVLREKMIITPEMLASPTDLPQKTPDGEQELIYWNAHTRIARSIWKGSLFENNIMEVEWLPQTDIVFLITQVLPSKALLLNLNPNAPIPIPEWKLLKMTEGQSRAIDIPMPNVGIGGSISLSASKTQPLMMLHLTQDNNEPTRPDSGVTQNTAIYLIRKDGRIDTPLTVPNADKARMILPMWDKEGNPVLYWVGEGKNRLHYSINPKTLGLIPLEGKIENQDYTEPDRTRAGVLSLKPQKLTANVGETHQSTPLLWMESSVPSEFPRLLLSGDAIEGKLMAKGDGALYQSQGALWYAPFLRLNQAQFLAARQAALKAVAISNAKQAGLGLIMYAQDYDETLPDPDGIKDKVYPYVKNHDVVDGLVYTYAGGKLADIDKPAETIMGYVAGPGGRANIFVDGHVKWINDPKP